jgi:MFS transporter, MHS family, proline/betaine transporter
LLITFGVVVLGTVAVYTILFMPTYAFRMLSLPAQNSFAAGLLTGVIQLVLIPIFGALSDRLSRTLIPIIAAGIILIGIYPTLAWLSIAPTIYKLLVVQGLLGIVTAAYLGSLPALMSELFPVETRGTGLSISYAVGVAIFGGFAPFIHVWLIAETGNILAPAFYVAFAAIVSLSSLFAARHLGFR